MRVGVVTLGHVGVDLRRCGRAPAPDRGHPAASVSGQPVRSGLGSLGWARERGVRGVT